MGRMAWRMAPLIGVALVLAPPASAKIPIPVGSQGIFYFVGIAGFAIVSLINFSRGHRLAGVCHAAAAAVIAALPLLLK